MLRAGMIRQVTSGIYNWLPLGWTVLQKIGDIIREEIQSIGCYEMLMPSIQPAELWQASGRYDDYGKEMLRMTDRHDRSLLFGPTHEEVITALAKETIGSYRQLPMRLFQIQWKFRDEIRPRFGVMRGREFLMKDAYSFDLTEQAGMATYRDFTRAYLRIFHRLGLRAVPVRANTGAIGGDCSHEFHIIAETGESALYYDRAFTTATVEDWDDWDRMTSYYSAADDRHVPEDCPLAPEDLLESRGIEVGHIFHFGHKYAASMGLTVAGPDRPLMPWMGSYGIGVSRLVGAIIEASHDERGIRWPLALAPFHVSLLNLRPNDEACRTMADSCYRQLKDAGLEVLYDDTDESAGGKFATHDLIGMPYRVSIGPRGVKAQTVDVHHRLTGEDISCPVRDVAELLERHAMQLLG
jgi:prolyl-tRNA synthetase